LAGQAKPPLLPDELELDDDELELEELEELELELEDELELEELDELLEVRPELELLLELLLELELEPVEPLPDAGSAPQAVNAAIEQAKSVHLSAVGMGIISPRSR
jgi:hypothetical protein